MGTRRRLNLSNMRALEYLVAVADTGHFGRAAEQCLVTQPALSMQIQRLEELLGLRLVERTRQGARLTPAGIDVVRRAEPILTAITDLEDWSEQRSAGFAATINLGVIPSIAPYLLPGLLPALDASRPQIHANIREAQTATLVQDLARGHLDMVILALPYEPMPEGFTFMPLFEDGFVVAADAATAARLGDPVAVQAVAQERLLLLEPGHCLRDQALAFCGAGSGSGDSLQASGSTSLATIMQMVAHGHGITILPQLAVQDERVDPRIHLLPFAGAVQPSRQVALAWRQQSGRASQAARVAELVRLAAPQKRAA